MIIFNLAIFVIYGLAYFLDAKYSLSWMKIIPGVLLLFYLPGYNLSTILHLQKRKYEWFISLPINIISSISILGLIFLAIRTQINYDPVKLVAMVLGVNIVLFILALATALILKLERKISLSSIKDKKTLAFFGIPFLIFAVKILVNPYIFEIDSLHYFDAYKSILKFGTDWGRLFEGREVFSFFMISARHVAGLGYEGFFKFLSPLIFYFTSAFLINFIRSKNSQFAWVYLLVLTSPILIVMNEGVRPETYNIALTIPVLALSYLALKERDYLLSILSVIFSLVALKFHEIGAILLFTAILSLIILVVADLPKTINFIKKNSKISTALILSYSILFLDLWPKLADLFKNRLINYFWEIARQGFSQINWDWWFLDSAKTQNGGNISWPGASAIFYYLYNGAYLLVFAAILLVILIFSKKKKRGVFLPYLPLAFFFFIHFAIAEILPRIGILIMPNRSWPYISMALILACIILVKQISNLAISNQLRKVSYVGGLLIILAGSALGIAGSVFMGAMVLPQEKTAIQSLKDLPEDSVVVSTQRNQNLAKIYGNKFFLQIKKSEFTNENFENEVTLSTKEIAQKKIDGIFKIAKIYKSRTETITENGEEIYRANSSRRVYDLSEKKEILAKHDPRVLESLIERSRPYEIDSKDIYFIYSFAKLDNGIINKREWWRTSADIANYDFFKGYKGEAVAKDNNFILIKITD